MNTHTPGPWTMHDGATITVTAKIDRATVTVAKAVYGYGDDMRANARLIAAAPELLEALKAVVEAMSDCPDFGAFVTLSDGRSIQPLGFARAAIAKATNA